MCAELQRTRTFVALTRASAVGAKAGASNSRISAGGTHIGPNKTARLTRGVGFVLNPFRNEAGGRLGRHFHDVAVHVEFPAMIEATKTALLIAGEYQ